MPIENPVLERAWAHIRNLPRLSLANIAPTADDKSKVYDLHTLTEPVECILIQHGLRRFAYSSMMFLQFPLDHYKLPDYETALHFPLISLLIFSKNADEETKSD